MTPDIWKPVVGWEEFYEVSSRGVVRSVGRFVAHHTGKLLWRKPRVLRGCMISRYVQVSLSKNGRTSTHRVHSLVAAAFIGPRPLGALVCHNDGDRKNNAVENLRYDTSQGNSDDMSRHGTVLRGERHGSSKLTAADVVELRSLKGTAAHADLAERFSISVSQVQNILYGKQWRHPR